MTTFNQFKNNTEILKKYLQKMNTISQCEIKPQWVDENLLKQNNPHIFLQLLHYALIKFSPFVLFIKVLDFYPTIKDDHDKKFLTNSLSLSRKLFDIDAKIDIQQFLSPKFVQKKTQFTSQLCKAAYEYHLKWSKSSNQNKVPIKRDNQISNYIPTKLPNNYKPKDDDSEDEAPRNLNVAPSNTTKRPIIHKKDIQQSSSDEDFKELVAKKKQLNRIKQRNFGNSVLGNKSKVQNNLGFKNKSGGNMFPKNVQREESQQQAQFFHPNQNQFKNKQTILNPSDVDSRSEENHKEKIRENVQTYSNSKLPQKDSAQYVTREQFMQIVTGMTRNFTQLLTKFNDFQSQVGGWVQNVNAKISILEENIKTIKNNL